MKRKGQIGQRLRDLYTYKFIVFRSTSTSEAVVCIPSHPREHTETDAIGPAILQLKAVA